MTLAILLLGSSPLPAAVSFGVQPMSPSSFLLDAKGRLYDWGINQPYGQLGLGTLTNPPLPIPAPWPAGVTNFLAVAAGQSHTLVLGGDGQLYSCGANNAGQLGQGFTSAGAQSNLARVLLPAGVAGWKATAAGGNSSWGIANTDQLYAWGAGNESNLGIGPTTNPASPLAVVVPAGVTGWKAVAGSSLHSLALTLDGRLFSTGSNPYGQLGDGTTTTHRLYQLVPFPAGIGQWQAIGCGAYTSYALSTNGLLYAWGYNASGETGTGTNVSTVLRPTPVLLPPGVTNWKAFAVGSHHVLALGSDNQLYAWGANNNYQLGIGATQMSQFKPVLVTKPTPSTRWQAIGAGANHSLAVDDAGQLYSWGGDNLNQQPPPSVPLLLGTLGNLGFTPADYTPVVSITATDPVGTEAPAPDRTNNTAAFTITRTGFTTTNLTVNLWASGTAIYGIDYRTAPSITRAQDNIVNSVTIPAGSNSVTILVTPLDDNLAETNETLTLTIVTNALARYVIGQPNTASITLLEDGDSNRPPVISLLYPLSGSRFVTGKNILLSAGVFDPDANAQNVEFFVDGASVGAVNIANTITNYASYLTSNFNQFVTQMLPNLPPGPHTASAQVTDLFGAQASTLPVTFIVLPLGNNPPAVPVFAAEPTANSSYFLDGNGALYVWGWGISGQLGNHTNANLFSPVQLAVPDGASAWSQVSGGQSHALALANNGQIYAWGSACCGQLGLGLGANSPSQNLPVQVPLPPGVQAWRKASAGGAFSLAIADTGQLYAWGDNSRGELGIGSTTSQYVPVPVPFPDGVTNWTDVASGLYHTVALANNGSLYAWGSNSFGQLGNGLVGNIQSNPVPVLTPSGVTAWSRLAVGQDHNGAFDTQGNLYLWGYNTFGQVTGASSNAYVLSPTLIPPRSAPWAVIALGGYHTVALAQDGQLYAWGYNASGQLGAGTNGSVPLPLGATRWVTPGAGEYRSLAVADNCQVYAWGYNGDGNLGDGTRLNRSLPVPTQGLNDICYTVVNHPPAFTKGPDVTVVGDTGAHALTNWATSISPGAFWETNQTLTFMVTNDNPSLFTLAPAVSSDGTLSFTLAKDHSGSALVTVVLHDDGGTANGGQDTSAPQTFQLTVTKADDAPVVFIRVFPRFTVSADDTNQTVIAVDGLEANVILDASLSTNSANDPMTFQWFDAGAATPFATSVVAERVLPVGSYPVRLDVYSGDDETSASVLVQVITPVQAVGEVLARAQAANLGHPADTLLLNALNMVQKDLTQDLPWVAVVHLGTFQTKVQDHLGSSAPALAADLIQAAQQLIVALQGQGPSASPKVALRDNGHGGKHLFFNGSPGGIHLVQASTNLRDWETIGVATETQPGQFQFEDAAPVAAPARFYRLRLP